MHSSSTCSRLVGRSAPCISRLLWGLLHHHAGIQTHLQLGGWRAGTTRSERIAVNHRRDSAGFFLCTRSQGSSRRSTTHTRRQRIPQSLLSLHNPSRYTFAFSLFFFLRFFFPLSLQYVFFLGSRIPATSNQLDGDSPVNIHWWLIIRPSTYNHTERILYRTAYCHFFNVY